MGSAREQGKKGNGFANVVRLVRFGLVVAAVAKEAGHPGGRADLERGGGRVRALRLSGCPPSPGSRSGCGTRHPEHLISPHVFGVGWTLNVGRAVELVRQKAAEADRRWSRAQVPEHAEPDSTLSLIAG